MKARLICFIGNLMMFSPFKFNYYGYYYLNSKYIDFEYGMENDGSDGNFVVKK